MSITSPAIQTSKVIYLLGAMASGVTIGYFAAWVRESDGMPSSEYAAFIFQATCSYLLVALLTPQISGRLTRRIPRWASVAVLGAILTFITINLVGDLRHIYNFQVKSTTTLVSAVEGEAERLIANVLIFSLIALPIMCITHYLGYVLTKLLHKTSRVERSQAR